MIQRRLTFLSTGLVGALFLTWAAVFIYKSSFIVIGGDRYFCLFDDAMISLRYAWNLAHGEGLVWNPGTRTEGFTNMLLTLVMAVPSALLEKRMTVLSVQIFGALTLLFVAYFSMRVGLALSHPTSRGSKQVFWATLFFAAPLLYYPLCYWTLMGMETGLLTMLLYAAVFMAIDERYRREFHPALPILLGLAFWVRPDAAIPIVCVLTFRAVGLLTSGRSVKTVVLDILGVGLFVLSLTLFRRFYYGQYFPNTYTLKMANIPLGLRFENGVGYLRQFMAQMWFPLTLGAVGFVIQRDRPKALLAVLVLLALAYQVYAGGDPWLYWRFLSPYVPLVFVLALGAVPRTAAAFRDFVARGRPGAQLTGLQQNFLEITLASTVLCAFYGVANAPFRYEALLWDLPYNVEFNHATVSVARALEEVTDEEATLGVFWAGSIPYYTGRVAIDFLGKTDEYIASLPPDTSGKISWRGMKSVPGHNKYDLTYSIVKKRPTYVQDGRWGGQSVFDFLKAHYRGVYYKGVPLMLLRESPSVNWDLLDRNLPASPHAKPLGRVHAIP